MKIKHMTATFGRLKQASLTPGPGLTVITAPNEGGKSTWAAFVTAMLYGVDTRVRDRGDRLADKTRYLPWSGAPMEGELVLEWEGRDITLRRYATKSGSFSGFEAVYTATGDPVPQLTAATAGQTLTGVGKEVFLRTALVGQGSTAVTTAPDLERRIAALATSGQEDVSFSLTQRTLKDWRNRRRLNRANGLLPQLEEELSRVRQALAERTLARRRQEEAAQQLALLEGQQAELERDARIHQRLARKELNRRYALALDCQRKAEAALAALPRPDPRFAGLTAGQARQAAAQHHAQQEAHRQEVAHRQALRAEAAARRNALGRARAALAILLAAGGAALLAGILLPLNFLCVLGGTAAVAAAIAMAVLTVQMGRSPSLPPSADESSGPEDDLLSAAQAYGDWLAQKQQLEAEVRHCRERADDLRSQGAQEADTLEFLTPPTRSPQEIAAQLSAVGQEIARWKTLRDQATGALGADLLDLESRRDWLEDQLAQRTRECSALDLALEGLESANAALRERFSPALNREAGALFSRLTGGCHPGLTLARDFSATSPQQGSPLPRSALYLSGGTLDQLYLSVRLALCQLVMPGVPILLDDTLANFDDARAELALDCLLALSRDRQILLFSCHSREARWAGRHGVPILTL